MLLDTLIFKRSILIRPSPRPSEVNGLKPFGGIC
jgi:hypothetical protein